MCLGEEFAIYNYWDFNICGGYGLALVHLIDRICQKVAPEFLKLKIMDFAKANCQSRTIS